ncbi:hypothetical protein ACFOWZ_09070 [Lentzea rhizosphaerae]|uniref:Resolvase, N terminal domain n=1 Tax=Lentzea rhizosphaerae TaxID=2041025 RepID=A0ABV8BRP6_9PSEU
MLSPEDVDLVANIRKIADLMPGVAFDIVMETLSPEREHEFGQILVALGELLARRAERRGFSGKTVEHDQRKNLSTHLDCIALEPGAVISDKPRRK